MSKRLSNLVFLLFVGTTMLVGGRVDAQDQGPRLTWAQWAETMEYLHGKRKWKAPPFEGESAKEAIDQIQALDSPEPQRLAALAALRPVMKDDGTNAFQVIKDLVFRLDLDETYRYQLASALALNRDAEAIISELARDERFGDSKLKAGYIMRLLDIRLATQSPPSVEAMAAVRAGLKDKRTMVRTAAVRYLGSNDPASEQILMSELREPEVATLPTRLVVEQVDATKDDVAELLIPLLKSQDEDVRKVTAHRVVINSDSHKALWQEVEDPQTDPEFAKQIVDDLSNFQEPVKFLDSALRAAESDALPDQIRVKTLIESDNKIRSNQDALERQQRQFDTLLDDLRESTKCPQRIKDAIQGMRSAGVNSKQPSFGLAGGQHPADELMGYVATAKNTAVPETERRDALIALQKKPLLFFETALAISKNIEDQTDVRALAIRSLAFGLRDKQFEESQIREIRELTRKLQESQSTKSIEKSLQQLEKWGQQSSQ